MNSKDMLIMNCPNRNEHDLFTDEEHQFKYLTKGMLGRLSFAIEESVEFALHSLLISLMDKQQLKL